MALIKFGVTSFLSRCEPFLGTLSTIQIKLVREKHEMPEKLKNIPNQVSPNVYEVVQYYYHNAAQRAEKMLMESLEKYDDIAAEERESYIEEFLVQLGQPALNVEVKIPIKNKSGKFEILKGFRSHHVEQRVPGEGGIRFTEDLQCDIVNAFAYLNTFKSACFNIPFGGAFGGIQLNREKYSTSELKTITQQYTQALLEKNLIGPGIDIPAPDMNTGAREMRWVYELYRKTIGLKDSNVLTITTGKPEIVGGVPGYDQAAGRSVFYAGECFIEDKDWMDFVSLPTGWEGKTAIVQGFGNVGSNAAIFLQKAGVKIIGVSEKDVALFNPGGINVEELANYTKEKNAIKGFPNAKESESLLSENCDILLACAKECTITNEIANDIKAKIVLEGANSAITPSADAILLKKGTIIVPDLYCNAGSVIASYLEYSKNINDAAQGSGAMTQLSAKLNDVFDYIKKCLTCPNPEELENKLKEILDNSSDVDAKVREAMKDTGRRIKETANENILCNDLRTAAYLNSIQTFFERNALF